MFTHQNNAAKITFVHGVNYLHQQGVQLIDCQLHTQHLARFGAKEMSFTDFSAALKTGGAKVLPKVIAEQVLYANGSIWFMPTVLHLKSFS